MERLTMKSVREVLRLKLDCHLSARQIARTSGFARSTVADYLSRFEACGVPEHMPPNHRDAEFSPERFLRWAQKYGPATMALVEKVLQRRQHVEQSYRSILGILRLADRFGDDRLEAACRRALPIKAYNYRSIESILKKGLDGLELETINEPVVPVHGNVRGAHYFH